MAPWRGRCDRGDALVVFCVAMVLVILPLGGISLDLWHAISDERALQSAADAAATAGAGAINATAYRVDPNDPVLDPMQATGDALASLQDQPDLPSLSQAPQIDATAHGITVVLHEHVQLTLLRLALGNRTINLVASSSAVPRASGRP
jgi:hypothetical protein